MFFSIDLFKQKNIALDSVFKMEGSIDMTRIDKMREEWKANDGVDYADALSVIGQRTSINYFNEIQAAQSGAIDFSKSLFPAYEFLLADVIYDDWMSIVDPHQNHKRDHSVHQPLTAFVVSELLGRGDASQALQINGQSLLTLCTNKFLNGEKTVYLREYLHDLYPSIILERIENNQSRYMMAETLFYEAAVMSALFHDIGYPWQYIKNVCSGIGFANDIVDTGLSFSAEGIYDQIKDRLLIYPFYGYSASAMNHPTTRVKQEVLCNIEEAFNGTHGFPGALAFQQLNDLVRSFPMNIKYNDAIFRFMQDWAAVGIMMHDMVRQYYGGKDGHVQGKKPVHQQYRLSFDTDPLSCLIAMADIFEEFARPFARFKPYNKGVVARFEYPCERTDVTVNGKTLFVKYTYADKALAAGNRGRREKEVDDYFNDECGFVNLASIGIEKAVCEVV